MSSETSATLPEAVVVFGASGFIGRNVISELAGKVDKLVAVNSSGRPVPGSTETVAASQLDSLGPLPRDAAIIHVAAFRYFASSFGRQQAEILSANVALTDLVYRFALTRDIKEVRVASSMAVYPADMPVLDDEIPLDLNRHPHLGESAYAWSKRWGEINATLWARLAGINTISFRLSNPFGPFDTLDESEAHVATAFVIRALCGTEAFEVRGDPEAERDFVFSGDVARAFSESLKLRGVNDAVNCAAGSTTRVLDLAYAAMRAAGRERAVQTNPPPAGSNQGVKIRRATAGRIRQLLPGLAPFRTLDEGMKLTLQWYEDALRR